MNIIDDMRVCSVVLCFICFASLEAQVSTKDSVVAGVLIEAHYGFHLPAADMAERFGVSSAVGPAVWYKTKKNWLIGIELNYEFGGNVKIEDSLFRHISTPEGFIIDGNGMYAEVFTYERGWHGYLKAGKIFPVVGPNPNCGLFFHSGIGGMVHKIRIYNQDQVAPQVSSDYKKGYDRLTGGIAFTQQFGYFNIGNRKTYSFIVSIEIIEGLTKPMRNYQYDLMGPEDDAIRLDILYGIRVSWMIPLFRQPATGYVF